MSVGLRVSGSFKNTLTFLNRIQRGDIYQDLQKFGQIGVDALASATPIGTGRTANSWSYKITQGRGKSSIGWYNSNENNGVNVAILLQYGHGTGTGGYVEGYDFINPAIRPIFDQIAEAVWYRVKSA